MWFGLVQLNFKKSSKPNQINVARLNYIKNKNDMILRDQDVQHS